MRLARRLLCLLYNIDFIFQLIVSINKHENLIIKSIDRWILGHREHYEGAANYGCLRVNFKLFFIKLYIF
jgi:hypothetical protein